MAIAVFALVAICALLGCLLAGLLHEANKLERYCSRCAHFIDSPECKGCNPFIKGKSKFRRR